MYFGDNLSVYKKKILFVTTIDFTKPFNGGTLYTKSIFDALSKLYDTDLFILKENRKLPTFIHNMYSLISGIFRDVPLNVIYNSSYLNTKNRREKDYDFIVIDHLESAEYRRINDAPFYLIAHNIESKLHKDKIRNRLISFIYRFKSKLESYEIKVFREAKGVICISWIDKSEIEQYNHNVVQLLPSFEQKNFSKIDSSEITLGFIGPSNWKPNFRAVCSINKKILPRLGSNHKFLLAGKGWRDSGLPFDEKITLLGYVKNIEDFWRRVDILIVPENNGAGVNVKICEALFYGVQVITHSDSARAIIGDDHSFENLYIADTYDEIINRVNEYKRNTLNYKFLKFTKSDLLEKLCNFLYSNK